MNTFKVLSTLGNTGGLSRDELLGEVIQTPSRAAKTCASMEEAGLLTRRPADDGTNQVILELTPREEALFEETFPGVVNYAIRDFYFDD